MRVASAPESTSTESVWKIVLSAPSLVTAVVWSVILGVRSVEALPLAALVVPAVSSCSTKTASVNVRECWWRTSAGRSVRRESMPSEEGASNVMENAPLAQGLPPIV